MIIKDTFSKDHLTLIRNRLQMDPFIVERSIFALGLLEALVQSGLKFVFKGGTSLMLLFNTPRRLSTDIDIVVPIGTNIKDYLETASKIFPFVEVEEQIRKGRNNIIKQHFKFFYDSPTTGKAFYILLDVLYEDDHYAETVEVPINSSLLIADEPYVMVTVPSTASLLGDKLTAFAPHTTGVPLGIGKNTEVIKQLYDVSTLIDVFDDLEGVLKTYNAISKQEIAYRGLDILPDDALLDTIKTALCIASQGKVNGEDYLGLMEGIRGLVNFIAGDKFSVEETIKLCCKIIHFVACVISKAEYKSISDIENYENQKIRGKQLGLASYLKKIDLESFAHVVEASKLIELGD